MLRQELGIVHQGLDRIASTGADMAECAQSGVALYGNGFDELCKNDLHETRHISPMQSITFAATAGFGPFARSSTGTIIATAYALTNLWVFCITSFSSWLHSSRVWLRTNY